MKPIISKSDYETIKLALLQMSTLHKAPELRKLVEELDSGSIVNDNELSSDLIRINSYFEAQEEKSNKTLKYILTLPGQANITEMKISVLSPLGIALIGFKEGMTIDCALPVGNKKLKIIKVLNHSEHEYSKISVAQ